MDAYEDWLDDVRPDEPREQGDSRAVDTVTDYLARHPECAPGAQRATIKALAELEAWMPGHLRAKVWPA